MRNLRKCPSNIYYTKDSVRCRRIYVHSANNLEVPDQCECSVIIVGGVTDRTTGRYRDVGAVRTEWTRLGATEEITWQRRTAILNISFCKYWFLHIIPAWNAFLSSLLNNLPNIRQLKAYIPKVNVMWACNCFSFPTPLFSIDR